MENLTDGGAILNFKMVALVAALLYNLEHPLVILMRMFWTGNPNYTQRRQLLLPKPPQGFDSPEAIFIPIRYI